MTTVRGSVRSVDVEDGRTTVVILTAPNEPTTVFVDTLTPAHTGDAGHDAQVSTARKTALLLAASWGIPVEVDVDANRVVNYVILKSV